MEVRRKSVPDGMTTFGQINCEANGLFSHGGEIYVKDANASASRALNLGTHRMSIFSFDTVVRPVTGYFQET